jgi:hypothetical protein
LENYNLRGRAVSASTGKLCVFKDYVCDSACQYLTTDGFMFTAIPLQDGGMLTELEYASHKLYKPRTKLRNNSNTLAARYVLKLTVVDGQAKHKLTIVFQDIAATANFTLMLKRMQLTVEELLLLHNATAMTHPVICVEYGLYETEVRKA